MLASELVHCSVDHADLRGVAVHDSDLPALLDKVGDHLCSALYCFLLFRKISSHILVANSHYNAFFCHIQSLSLYAVLLYLF